MNWTLLAVAAIIIVCILVGMKRGLVRMIFYTLSFVLAIFLTNLTAPYVTNMIKNNTSIDDGIESSISDSIGEMVEIPGSMQVMTEVKNLYGNRVSGWMSDVIISTAVYAILFVLIMIILRIIGMTLKIIDKIPVVRSVNRISGGIMGAVEGLLVVWMFFLIIVIAGNTVFANRVYNDVRQSVVLSFLYDKNLILNTFIKICIK